MKNMARGTAKGRTRLKSRINMLSREVWEDFVLLCTGWRLQRTQEVLQYGHYGGRDNTTMPSGVLLLNKNRGDTQYT